MSAGTTEKRTTLMDPVVIDEWRREAAQQRCRLSAGDRSAQERRVHGGGLFL
jgi:hypothetical protein